MCAASKLGSGEGSSLETSEKETRVAWIREEAMEVVRDDWEVAVTGQITGRHAELGGRRTDSQISGLQNRRTGGDM